MIRLVFMLSVSEAAVKAVLRSSDLMFGATPVWHHTLCCSITLSACSCSPEIRALKDVFNCER